MGGFSPDRIDFRSDTVSWPTPAMREAMASARVGDDVYGEDPTVNELEALAAAKVGKEAGLFVVSGTMGNLVAIMSHAGRGDEAILGNDSHVFSWEAGSMAALGSVTPYPLPTDRYGRIDPAAVVDAIRDDDPHLPRSRLVLVENSYGAKHGYPLPPAYFSEIESMARQHELAVHLDGARLFNAAVAQQIDPSDITRHVDSVTFCLSKGLCAPVGSVLCGSADFINRARRIRKALGGGMRQAGILAAAGIVALNDMVERLAIDHHHARQLAEGLAGIPGILVEPEMVRTNMVFFELGEAIPYSSEQIADHLREKAGIWVGTNGPRGFRAVTHYWIGPHEVGAFLDGLVEIIGVHGHESAMAPG
jgi:threonine aldolase